MGYVRTSVRAWILAGLLAASGTSAPAAGLSFEDATAMVLGRSDEVAGAKAAFDSKSHRANSLDYLHLPRVGIEARVLDSEKTVKLDLSGVKSEAETVLPLLNETYGATIASEIPSDTVLGVHISGVQSNVTAELPLYTGGRIDAMQDAASDAVHAAGAELTLTEQRLRTKAAHVYFLYQLAQKVRDVRAEACDGLREHLRQAKAAEQVGTIPHAQSLQAQVAYDDSRRKLATAETNVTTAGIVLQNLLHMSVPPETSTPLFVVSKPLPKSAVFIDDALKKHAALARLSALEAEAGAGVQVERAARFPKVFLFGSYKLTGRDWDMTTPDWAFGIGMHYDLFSGIDRSEAELSAVDTQMQVSAVLRQTRRDLETAVASAWQAGDAARTRFLLLDSSLASARENVRVQTESFRAGYATSLDVIDARLRLASAEAERAEAAFQYDDALAELLYASGAADAFPSYIAKADRVIAP